MSPPTSDQRTPSDVAENRNRSRRFARAGVAVAIATLVAALGYAAAWQLAAGRLRTAAETWIDARRAEGYTVELTDVAFGGFPSQLEVRVANPRVASPPAQEDWAWSADRLLAAMSVFDWSHATIKVEGEQVVDIPANDGPLRIRATAAEFSVTPEFGGHRPAATVRANDLRVSTEQGHRANVQELVAIGRPPTARSGEPSDATYAVFVRANDLQLASAVNLPFGPDVRQFTAEAQLNGTLAPLPRLETLLRWRDAGGTVEIVQLALDYGPIAVTGNGTLALDKAAQPIGAFSLRLRGLVEAIEMLQARGIVASGVTATARTLWGVFARRPADGGPPAIDLPLTVQDQLVSLGPLVLAKLPKIEWGHRSVEPR
jgi:hypothetical protein